MANNVVSTSQIDLVWRNLTSNAGILSNISLKVLSRPGHHRLEHQVKATGLVFGNLKMLTDCRSLLDEGVKRLVETVELLQLDSRDF